MIPESKGHIPRASLGESLFFVENMMNRSENCLGKTRPILKQLGKNRRQICHAVQSETQDEPSNKYTNLSRDALRGDPFTQC